MPCNGGDFTLSKQVAFQLLAVAVSDCVITSISIAYPVQNIMDETLLVTVCSVYFWNSVSLDVKFGKCAVIRPSTCVYLKRQAGSHIAEVCFLLFCTHCSRIAVPTVTCNTWTYVLGAISRFCDVNYFANCKIGSSSNPGS